MVNANDKVYAIGGYDYEVSSRTDAVLRLDCKETLESCAWTRLTSTKLAIPRYYHSVIPMPSAHYFRNKNGYCECPVNFDGDFCQKCGIGFEGENCCNKGFTSSKSSSRCVSDRDPSNYFLKTNFKMPVKNKICIFLIGNYTSSAHKTYKCVNTTKDYLKFDQICLEELTSCPEVSAVVVNQDNQTYVDVIMEAKKVQIRYSWA